MMKTIREFILENMSGRLARVAAKIKDTTTLVKFFVGYKTGNEFGVDILEKTLAHISENTSIWPACRNLFSYRVSLSVTNANIVNAPAVLVNSVDGASNFILWKEALRWKKDDGCHWCIPRGYGPMTNVTNVTVVLKARFGQLKDMVLILPDNEITNEQIPDYVRTNIRLARYVDISTRHIPITLAERAVMAREFTIDKQIALSMIQTEDNDVDSRRQMRRFGSPMLVDRSETFRRGKRAAVFADKLLPSGLGVSKTNGNIELHIAPPYPYSKRFLDCPKVEEQATYVMGKRLAKSVIPDIAEHCYHRSLLERVVNAKTMKTIAVSDACKAAIERMVRHSKVKPLSKTNAIITGNNSTLERQYYNNGVRFLTL